MFRILRVTGDSMSPEYQEGDFVVIATGPLFSRRLRDGDAIVFQHQHYGTLIKRVQRITDEGIYVVGAQENSLDSSRLGPVRRRNVRGRVVWHIRRRYSDK
ncbi:MAG: hypothetical protein GXP40_02880 [Chloroflexi bacterium]|nr:hypothetical protein [Chloroflexota bacterium]